MNKELQKKGPFTNIHKVRTCTVIEEKRHNPMFADLIDLYMLKSKQAGGECEQFIGNDYFLTCMHNIKEEINTWYNMAVYQRMSDLMNTGYR